MRFYSRSKLVAVTGDIDESDDMDSELSQNRSNDIEVEDVRLRTFLGETFNRLGSGDGQEADAHEHTTNCNLTIAELDTFEVQHTETVGADQTIESENFVHLNSCHESATTLSNDVGNGNDVAQLARERGSD